MPGSSKRTALAPQCLLWISCCRCQMSFFSVLRELEAPASPRRMTNTAGVWLMQPIPFPASPLFQFTSIMAAPLPCHHQRRRRCPGPQPGRHTRSGGKQRGRVWRQHWPQRALQFQRGQHKVCGGVHLAIKQHDIHASQWLSNAQLPTAFSWGPYDRDLLGGSHAQLAAGLALAVRAAFLLSVLATFPLQAGCCRSAELLLAAAFVANQAPLHYPSTCSCPQLQMQPLRDSASWLRRPRQSYRHLQGVCCCGSRRSCMLNV